MGGCKTGRWLWILRQSATLMAGTNTKMVDSQQARERASESFNLQACTCPDCPDDLPRHPERAHHCSMFHSTRARYFRLQSNLYCTPIVNSLHPEPMVADLSKRVDEAQTHARDWFSTCIHDIRVSERVSSTHPSLFSCHCS